MHRPVTRPAGCPAYRYDLYSTDAILDPYPHYAALRQLGAVVWLPRQRVFALPRYAECKAVLRDDVTFLSGHGVGLNPIVNKLSRGTTLNSDGERHDHRRKLLAHRMLPRALRAMTGPIQEQADDLVGAAVKREYVDGVADLATALPVAVVPDLLGWPEDGRDNLLRWGSATFDALGPVNHYAARAATASLQMKRFSKQVVRRRSVTAGSMGHDILLAGDAGKLTNSECSALMVDYLAPSLDTTISGIASALALFAKHPDQWRLLKTEPTLLPNAINEVLRYESPLRAFSRKALCDSMIAGVAVPAGARVLVIYASANRDEREWSDPDAFDIRHDANRQLGFGHGSHACAGQGLARVEMEAMLTALIQRVSQIELAGEPTWAPNNIIRCYQRLPLRLVAD
ncbi:MAG TPA: cytochrome P450 [Mycobacterium sp.]|nr:cytochrome P450 [Mycobacterium sp.]HTX93972.1 cytochrome P450 [Mycobacterium sp.]